MRDPNNTRDERHKALGIMVIVSVLLVIMAKHAEGGEVELIPLGPPAGLLAQLSPLRWDADMVPVYYNPDGAPDAYKDDIVRAVWLWRERTGLNLVYHGMTDRQEISGAVLIRWTNLAQLIRDDMLFVEGYAKTWYWKADSRIDRSQITLKSDTWAYDLNCARTTLIHEIGHAIGILGHSPNSSDTMYAFLNNCRAALSSYDVSMTAYDGGDRCFVQLTDNYSLFVPDYQGMEAMLRYNNDRWQLTEYRRSGDSVCDTVTLSGADVIFSDVRRIDYMIKRAELESVGNDKWILRWAE